MMDTTSPEPLGQDGPQPEVLAPIGKLTTLFLKDLRSISRSLEQMMQGVEADGFSASSWLLLGLVAGFIGSKIVNRAGEGIVRDILLGVLGAFIGGFLFNVFGASGVTGLNLYSLLVAVVGAVILLIGYHAIFRRTRIL